MCRVEKINIMYDFKKDLQEKKQNLYKEENLKNVTGESYKDNDIKSDNTKNLKPNVENIKKK